MLAIWIKAAERDVIQVQYNAVSDLQRMVGGYLEAACQWPNGDVLYVDESGALKRRAYGFMLSGLPEAINGDGVIVGPEVGAGIETAEPGVTLAQVQDALAWTLARGARP